jgi:LPXTG-site transpeptidase (sortase) family protein
VSISPHRIIAALLALSLLLVSQTSGIADAQSARRCFPETGYCIAGRIRQYWDANGGLRVFGYPITPQQPEQIEGRAIQVQWFERNRLELHPETRRPYDVLLGRIGAERLGLYASGEQAAQTQEPGPGCRFFAETGRAACGAILAAWRASGLNLDGDPRISEQESKALFGLPLTELHEEDTPGGRYTVQWFERARFELHPENAPPDNVQLGLLGSESSPVPAAPQAVAQASAPARVVIDSIGMDQRVVGVGVDSSGELVVPDHDVGWYTASALPGQGENVVFWGHVLRFRQAPKVPAPFERLKEVRVGARVTVYDDQGQAHAYQVTQKVEVTPDQVEYILPQGHERVTMVSCYGEFVIVGREVVDMTRRLIIIAEPVSRA